MYTINKKQCLLKLKKHKYMYASLTLTYGDKRMAEIELLKHDK